jgi:hypothetical protein
LYFPFEVDAMASHVVVSQQSTPFTDVVPGTGNTAVGLPANAPTDRVRPPRLHALPPQETVWNVDMFVNTCASPGFPLEMLTATPCPPPTPTASHVVCDEQETAVKALVPATTSGCPTCPCDTGRATPSPFGAVAPTAMHQFAVGQEIPLSTATPGTACPEAV